MAETLPDIQMLFSHYNALYFDDALGACIVTWAPRMRRSIGICSCIEAGHCEIHMSKSLLKLRSSSDLKNSLLHEMVHAFLWVKQNNKSRRHDTSFWAIANEINSSRKFDDQRPSSGYNISDQHVFPDEAKTGTVRHWMSGSSGLAIKRKIDGGSCSTEKTGHGDDSGNLSCEWHRHKKLCSGLHNKVGFSDFRGKQRAVEGVEENDRGKITDIPHVNRRIQPVEEHKPIKSEQKKSIKFCSYRPSSGYNISDQHVFPDEAKTSTVRHWMSESSGHAIKRKIDGGSCSTEKTDHGDDCGNLSCEWHRHKKLCSGLHNKAGISDFRGKERAVEGVQENGGKITDISHVNKRIQPAEEHKPISSEQKKSVKFNSSVSFKTKSSENLQKNQIACKRKQCNEDGFEQNKSSKRKREISLVIPWLGVFTDEESEEDEEPLINKRSVRRMKEKESEERARQIALTHEIIYLD